MSDKTISNDAIVIERIFDAPVEVIWQLWTRPEAFKKWYGPTGFSVPAAEMDVRVGGKRLICMASPDGSRKMWSAGEYLEVVPNERLVYTDSMADAQGNILSPSAMGMPADYPMTTEITVILEAVDGGTKMVMTHAGFPADEQGASGGWTQAFDKLDTQIKAMHGA